MRAISPQGSDSAALAGAITDNSHMDMTVAERILDMVASVPRGRVSTYGDIAALAGTRSPRLVGTVLASLSDDTTPWFRILRANGTPAAHLAVEQCARLRAEGVVIVDGRVNLRRYRWPDRSSPSGLT